MHHGLDFGTDFGLKTFLRARAHQTFGVSQTNHKQQTNIKERTQKKKRLIHAQLTRS